MASPNLKLIEALRTTASKLANGNAYQWGHMGSCNCGNLAQELTQYNKTQIHEYALRSRSGDWSEQTDAYCPTSNLPLDIVIDAMLESGLTREDLKNLERLSDRQVLLNFPIEQRHALQHNKRQDVALYMNAWATMLENELIESINIDDLEMIEVFS